MQDQRRVIQPPRCVLIRRFPHTGAIIALMGDEKDIRMHVREEKRVRVNDSGTVKKSFASLPLALALMDVLIGRQKKGDEQRQTSLQGDYTAHLAAEYVLGRCSNASLHGRERDAGFGEGPC